MDGAGPRWTHEVREQMAFKRQPVSRPTHVPGTRPRAVGACARLARKYPSLASAPSWTRPNTVTAYIQVSCI